jgi:hypothetical protein
MTFGAATYGLGLVADLINPWRQGSSTGCPIGSQPLPPGFKFEANHTNTDPLAAGEGCGGDCNQIVISNELLDRLRCS